MISIFKLQLKSFFMSSAFMFMAGILAFNMIVLLSNVTPQRTTLFSIIFTDVAFIAYFQFGGNYRLISSSSFSKKLETSGINPVTFKFIFVAFTVSLALTFTFLNIGIIYLLDTMNIINFLVPINWQYFWWGWLIYWVIIQTIVLVSFTYFLYRFISNQFLVFAILSVVFVIGILGGGTFGSVLIYDKDTGVVAGVKDQSVLIWLLIMLQPGWYANQLMVMSFKATSPMFDTFKPLNFSNYNTIMQYAFLIMPYVLISSFTLLPHALLRDNY